MHFLSAIYQIDVAAGSVPRNNHSTCSVYNFLPQRIECLSFHPLTGLCLSHPTPSHFTGHFSFYVCVCVCSWLHPAPRSTFSPVVWAAVSSWERQPRSQRSEWGSNQSHYHHCWCCRPERGQRAYQLPHRSSQPRPERGPLGDSQPLCVISTLCAPTGILEREGEREGGREGGQRERGKKEHPEAQGSFCDMWTMTWASESLTVADWIFAIPIVNRPSRGCGGRTCKLTSRRSC